MSEKDRAIRGRNHCAAAMRSCVSCRVALSSLLHRRRSSDLAPAADFLSCCRICGAATHRISRRSMRGLIVAANQNPQLVAVFSTFSATTPSIFLDIDRDKARYLASRLSSIFQALQTSLGGFFVNDINLFGRTWQVQVQAEGEDRASR